MDVDIFVKNLKDILKKRGISPTTAGRESGCGQDFIPNMERKKSAPSYIKVQKMAYYLGMTTSELLGEEIKPTSNYGDGLNEEQLEVIRRFEDAPPALRAAALAVLRSAEEQDKAQGGGVAGK